MSTILHLSAPAVWGLFVRLLGAVYLIAFASLWPQVLGIAGSQGITPVHRMLAAYRRDYPLLRRLAQQPTLLWLSSSDRMLRALVGVGMAGAVLVIVGGPASRWALLACWLAWLSLDAALDLLYPWDCLLFEAGFLALFLPTLAPLPSIGMASAPPALLAFAYQLLLVRVILGFGKIKFTGSTRKDRGYLAEFLVNQPFTNKLGWLAHHLPDAAHAAMLGFLFIVELCLPLLVFFPGWPRLVAAVGIVALMVGIQVTANFGYFNLLTAFLCVPLLGLDVTLLDVSRAEFAAHPLAHVVVVAWVLMALVFFPFNSWCTRTWASWPMWENVQNRLVRGIVAAARAVVPFRVVHAFGVFTPQSTPGVKFAPVLEGTRDGKEWREYRYRFFPTAEDSPPRFVAPHHPRWDHYVFYDGNGLQPGGFSASLIGSDVPYHFGEWTPTQRMMQRVLEGSPAVKSMFRGDPFDDGGGPPTRMRATLHLLEPTAPREAARGRWWRRTRLHVHHEEQGREDWRWDEWPGDPLFFHWDDVFHRRASPLLRAFHARARAAESASEVEAAAADTLAALGRTDPEGIVRHFWAEFLPTVARPGATDLRELPEAVAAARARFTPLEMRDFERVSSLFAQGLAERYERRIFTEPAAYFPLPSYFHVGMLCHAVILQGRDAYERALTDDAFLVAEAERLTAAPGMWLWSVLRYDTIVHNARKSRYMQAVAPQKFVPGLPGFLLLMEWVAGQLYDEAGETVPLFTRDIRSGRWRVDGFYPAQARPGAIRVPGLGPREAAIPAERHA